MYWYNIYIFTFFFFLHFLSTQCSQSIISESDSTKIYSTKTMKSWHRQRVDHACFITVILISNCNGFFLFAFYVSSIVDLHVQLFPLLTQKRRFDQTNSSYCLQAGQSGQDILPVCMETDQLAPYCSIVPLTCPLFPVSWIHSWPQPLTRMEDKWVPTYSRYPESPLSPSASGHKAPSFVPDPSQQDAAFF